ncbi:glutathione S-transferase family protein [Actibacterium sp. D379-3]
MYTVIGIVESRALRVLWMLEELDQPYDHIPAAPRSDAARAANPAGKVPVFIEDGVTITDSTAIVTYLADKHGALTFPAGTLDRARQDSLTQFLLDEFDAVLWAGARHSFILPKERRCPEVKDSLRWEFAQNQKTLVARMGDGPFLMGQTMTVPDIILTHCLIWARAAKFPLEEPALADYATRITARPAFQRAQQRTG